MTQEEKARAYDEALEVMRQWIAPCHTKEQLDTLKKSVFPELAESDDERIRKALYEFISDTLGDELDGYDISKGEALAYLEKQKEHPMELLEPDKNVEKIIEDVIRVYGKTQGEWVGGYDIDTLIVNLRRAFEQKVQKPAEWSEEDEEMLDAMIDMVSNSLYEPLCPREKMLSWLKSLPERFNLEPKQEWSEEDKGLLLSTKCIIDEVWHSENTFGYSKEELEEIWNWLNVAWTRLEYPKENDE